MIEQLAIRNIGVIEEATLDFVPGLNVISGETGAGKTMLLTAIGLIAGDRADTSKVRAGAKKASVDAIITGKLASAFAARYDGECDDDALIVARTVPASGRARASLGGRAVPASALSELAEQTITIHGQAQQLHLRSATYQRDTLDTAGGAAVSECLARYRTAFDHYQELDAQLRELTASSQARAQQRQALQTGIDMITAVEPYDGEDDELKNRVEALTNIDDMRRALSTSASALQADGGAMSAVDQAVMSLKSITRFDTSAGALIDQLQAANAQIGDVTSELGARLADLDADPAALDALHERRAEITALLRVYGPTIAEALAWREAAISELARLDDSPAAREKLAAALSEAKTQLERAASDLHDARSATANELSEAVGSELAALAMPKARLVIDVTRGDYATHGADTIQFMLQAHPGAAPTALGHGASGGELSRVMLALELCVAARGAIAGHTFVFDEIDAGIGGATARRVGERLARLAATHQVVVVTHVAQVAAYANRHFVVVKNDDASHASTSVKIVDGNAREVEIARMLGGTDTDAALRHAAELICDANVAR